MSDDESEDQLANVERLQLTIETLAELDNGIVSAQVIRHLQRLAHDCMDRPGDKTKRKATLEFSFEPVCDQSGQADSVNCTVEIKSKIPVHRSKSYEMGLSKAGFVFNRDVPDSLNQGVLFPKGNDVTEEDE